LALDGGEWLASQPGSFYLRANSQPYGLDTRADPRTGLEAVEKRKIPPPAED